VTKPAEPKARVRVRDEIVKAAKKLGAKVMIAKPRLNCALISCDDDIRDRPSRASPRSPIEDNGGAWTPTRTMAPQVPAALGEMTSSAGNFFPRVQ